MWDEVCILVHDSMTLQISDLNHGPEPRKQDTLNPTLRGCWTGKHCLNVVYGRC